MPVTRVVAAAIVVVALACSDRARADDAPSGAVAPAMTQRLRLELDGAYRPIFDVPSSGAEASVGLLLDRGRVGVLLEARGGLGVTPAGIHTWGLAAGTGLELALEPLRVDLEALARCLTYEPISQVSNAIACGIGARAAFLVDVVRFGGGGAMFAAASAEADYFGDSLMSVSPAIGIGARF
jgi:hypothetical protein